MGRTVLGVRCTLSDKFGTHLLYGSHFATVKKRTWQEVRHLGRLHPTSRIMHVGGDRDVEPQCGMGSIRETGLAAVSGGALCGPRAR